MDLVYPARSGAPSDRCHIGLLRVCLALDQRTGNDHSQTVFVRGDKDIAYARLMEVMDALRAAGYLKIGLVGLTVGIP